MAGYRGKLTIDHVRELEELIVRTIKETGREIDTTFDHYKECGTTDRRFYFDVLYATMAQCKSDWCERVYEYGNDNHIHTALKYVLTKLIAKAREDRNESNN